MGKKFYLLTVGVLVAVAAILFAAHSGNAGMSFNMLLDQNKGENRTVAKNRIAEFTTNKGTFDVKLFEAKAPITTKNFIDLSEKRF